MISDWEESEAINKAVQGLLEGLRGYPELGDLVEASLRMGKKTRPLILVLSCQACGGDIEESLDAALAIELVHSASLVHDDLFDDGMTRRGMPTIPRLAGVEAAVLCGDFMIAKSVELISRYSPDVVREFGSVGMAMAEGEAIDILSRERGMTEEEYFKSIRGKTAALFATAASIGARIADASEDDRVALRMFAEEVGLAYQIVDDLAEYLGAGRSKKSGRKAVILPEIYVSGGDEVARCEYQVTQLVDSAKARIEHFNAGARDKLLRLADYVTMDILMEARR